MANFRHQIVLEVRLEETQFATIGPATKADQAYRCYSGSNAYGTVTNTRHFPHSTSGNLLVSLNIMRRFTFCAGHRLVGHEGKCQNLHGHNYAIEIYVAGSEQDAVGRILDFKLLKQRVNGWIDENWDHTFILWKNDENALAAIRSSQPHRIYELDANPTAENMAIHFLQSVCPVILQGTGATAFKVRLWESEETCAEVSTVDR